MIRKIYFEDRPLFISEKETDVLKPYIHESGTHIVKSLQPEEIANLVIHMQQAGTNAGIIFGNVTEAFNALKKEFTLVQASGGLVYDQDKFLLIFRRGKWDLPKGKLDEGEDLGQCAVREIKEETGLEHIRIEQTLCVTYHTYFERGKHILKESHWHLMQGSETDALSPQTEEDIEKCEWVPIPDLEPYMKNAPASIIDVVQEGLRVLGRKRLVR